MGGGGAWAATLGDPDELTVDIHGFVSQGYLRSTGNDYLVDSTRGSFDFSEAGLNFTTQLTERLRVGLQIFAFDLGTSGTYRLNADWYYLDYRFYDWLGARAGRLKIPLGLYNDISDIDAARVPILLPSSLYPVTNREYLLAQTGAEVYGFVGLRRLGALEYRLYGGSIAIDLPSQIGSTTLLTALGVPFVGGGRLTWDTPLEGLRVLASGIALRLEGTYLLAPATAPLSVKSNVYGGIGSLEYAARELLLQAEYMQVRNETTGSDPTVVPSSTVVSEAFYGLGAYRLTPWLQPGLYFSQYHPNRNVRDGRENVQNDLSATLRFDINPYWIVKLEAHYLNGTAILGGTDAFRAAAPDNWMLFLIKTTAYF